MPSGLLATTVLGGVQRRGAIPLAIAAAVAALALALASCGGGSGSTSGGETAKRPSAGPVVKLKATTHHPRAGAPWPIAIEAHDRAGRPLRAEVRYQYLLGGAVVAHRSHYRFLGAFHDTFRWPARAIGFPLTFRAVVTTPLGTRRLDYPVQVGR